MKGLIQVTATRGGKIITSEVYGDLSKKQILFERLLNRHKIIHSERNLWKLSEVRLNQEIKINQEIND